jgi:hypothetical protein
VESADRSVIISRGEKDLAFGSSLSRVSAAILSYEACTDGYFPLNVISRVSGVCCFSKELGMMGAPASLVYVSATLLPSSYCA